MKRKSETYKASGPNNAKSMYFVSRDPGVPITELRMLQCFKYSFKKSCIMYT
jgi:hypothetical protein